MALSYFVRVLLGLDQWANTVIGGWPDETISARAGRLKDRFGWKQLAWVLNKLDSDHVHKAIANERNGSQQDQAYKDVYERLQEAKEAAKEVKEAVKEIEKAVDEVKETVH